MRANEGAYGSFCHGDGIAPSHLWKRAAGHDAGRWYGDVVLVAFLTVQLLDGVFTYLGLATFGPGAEGNPLLVWLFRQFGEGPGLAGAKVLAGSFGIALHLGAVHRVVCVLTLFYLGAAILPWSVMLFLS